jgi:hypothetical protein
LGERYVDNFPDNGTKSEEADGDSESANGGSEGQGESEDATLQPTVKGPNSANTNAGLPFLAAAGHSNWIRTPERLRHLRNLPRQTGANAELDAVSDYYDSDEEQEYVDEQDSTLPIFMKDVDNLVVHIELSFDDCDGGAEGWELALSPDRIIVV